MTRPPIPHTLSVIAEHWWNRPESDIYRHSRFADIGMGEPFCFRCGWLAPVDDTAPKGSPWKVWNRARGYLDRAHLADYAALRDRDRLDDDGPANLVPLCQWCHRRMPEHDHRDDAVAWILAGRPCGWIRQAVTDLVRLDGRPRQQLQRVTDRILADVMEVAG